MSELFEVRDHRNKAMFRVDDEYLNGYSKLCGTNATLVYLCLCRHADRHQESFPSVELMAEKVGVSRDSIMRGIKSLIDWNIIQKNRKRRENATWLNNTYILLDKSVWRPKPSSIQQHGSQVANEAEPSRSQPNSQVAHSDTKVTHKKVTHTEGSETSSLEISSLIKSFEVINPASKKFYGNKTQREACQSLIETYGFERVTTVIEKTLPKTNGMEFFPTITTPLQLMDKWATLEAQINKHQSKKLTSAKVAF